MEITFFHKNLTKKEEEIVVDYMSKKTKAIASLLTTFAKDAKLLNITTRKFEKHSAYEVEFCLNLPTKSLVATEASHNITKAIDLAKDRLIAQIKKHLGQLNNNRPHRSVKKIHQKELINAPFPVTEEIY